MDGARGVERRGPFVILGHLERRMHCFGDADGVSAELGERGRPYQDYEYDSSFQYDSRFS